MPAPLVILDRQHAGKPGNRADRGALADLDGDGRAHRWEREAMLTPRYLLHAEQRLLDLDIDVIVMSDGRYEDRHARARAYRADVYVAAHLNAGGGDAGLVFHDHRSAGGKLLAGLVAAQLGARCPELLQWHSMACRDDRADSLEPWLWRPYSTIEGVYHGTPVGICYEPAFMDNAAHASLLLTESGLRRLGFALAEGIADFLRS